MKYLFIIAFLSLLTTGCVHTAKDIAPDCIKINTGMGWEMQAESNTKKKTNVSVSIGWKLKKKTL